MLEPKDRKLKYIDGFLVQKSNDEMENETELETDEISMNVIKQVADSLEDMVNTEIDFPSNSKNKEKKMAILDIKVWVEKTEIKNKEIKKQIFFEYYEKPMCSRFVLMKDSAAPKTTCFNTGRHQKIEKLIN